MDRRFLLLLALLLFLATLLTLSATGLMRPVEAASIGAVAPVQKGLSVLTTKLSSLTGFVTRFATLEQENRRLRLELEELKGELVHLQEAGLENQRLRALLEYQQGNPEREYLAAAIIGRGQNNLVRLLTIDKGTSAGVQDGMVLVAGGGLVGKVVKTYEGAAKAVMINDPTSAVSAIILRSRAPGVLVAKPGHPLSLEFVDQDADVRVGDLVVTSGLGGGYPKGVLIGQVTHASGSPQELFKEVKVRPAARLGALEEVLVIIDFRPVIIP